MVAQILDKIMKRYIILVLLISVMPLSYSTLYAENTEAVTIKDIKSTKRSPWVTNVFVYGFWLSGEVNKICTAFNPHGRVNTYVSAANIGVSAEFKKGFWISILTNLGYEKSRYDIDRKLSFENGIISDWLTFDAAISSSIASGLSYCSGFQGKLLLASRNISRPEVCYDGIPFGCYNRVAFNWFFGAELSFHYVSLCGRVGVDIVPMLNPDKIPYYNLTAASSRIGGFNFALGAKFRIFTTKVKLNSQSLF